MSKFIAIIVLLLVSCGPKVLVVPAKFKTAPVIPEIFADDDEVIINKKVTYEFYLNAKGQIEAKKHFEYDGIIQNPENVRAVYQISYEQGFEKVTVNDVYYVSEGQRRNITNIQDIKLNSDVFYDNSRAKIFGFNHVTKGTMYHYSYTVHYLNLNLIEGVGMIDRHPIMNLEIGIKNNTENKIRFEKTGDFSSLKGRQITAIEAKQSDNYFYNNISNYKIYENYSMVRQIIPYYHVFIESPSMITDWQSMGKYFYELNQENFEISDVQYNNIISKFSYSNDDEFVQNLFYYIQDNIRYVALVDGIKAYKADSPLKVLTNKYGECKSMSFLLVSILRKKGIIAAPAIVNLGADNFNLALPKLYMANHCIAYAKTEKGDYWLDATGYYLKANSIIPSLSEKKALVVFENNRSELKETPTVNFKTNRIKYNLDLEIDAKDLIGKAEISMGSYSAFQFRNILQMSHQLDAKEKMKTILSSQFENTVISDIEIENMKDPSKDLILKFEIKYLNAVNSFGNRYLIDLNPISYLRSTKFSASKHEGDYFYDDPSNVELNINLKSADDFKLKSKSDDIVFTKDFISYERKYNSKNNMFSFNTHYRIEKTYMDETEFSTYASEFLNIKNVFNINLQLIKN